MKGYTLLEMTIVVAILALAATIAIPAMTGPDHSKLELASARVADAMRFARERARTSGVIHGVFVDVPNAQIRVFRTDGLPGSVLQYDVRDPVSKQIYVVALAAAPLAGVTIDSIDGAMQGSCNEPTAIAFGTDGVTRCADPVTTRILSAGIALELGALESTVAADSYTGRVTVQ